MHFRRRRPRDKYGYDSSWMQRRTPPNEATEVMPRDFHEARKRRKKEHPYVILQRWRSPDSWGDWYVRSRHRTEEERERQLRRLHHYSSRWLTRLVQYKKAKPCHKTS